MISAVEKVSGSKEAIAALPKIVRGGDALPEGYPQEYGQVDFLSEDGCYASGLWAAEAGVIPIEHYPVDEHCTVITGEVVLTDAQGHSEAFTSGMTFVVRKGFRGTWYMPVPTAKFFACYGTKETVSAMAGQG